MRLRIAPRVENDLREISAYIAQDSPRYASIWIRKLRSSFKEIASRPRLYRLRAEIAADVRLAPLGNYIIVFRVCQDTVRIERVLHASRDLNEVLSDLEH